ncbi:MAG: phosphate ABC transporter substrate-binding protein PstS [Candidatus Brockarchaeota archaeon]|nr:phosphate ABC transporter substrate-binding protein PstS [Candidatus Brockarchaeota archaeon]
MNRRIMIVLLVAIPIAAGTFLVYQQFTKPQRTINLNGAGASFPFPLIDKWVSEYSKIKPNIIINYQSIGSGGGIRQHTEKTVNFAASDAPLNLEQASSAPNTLHIPFTIGGVAIVYNLPEVTKGLKFSGEVLADIFMGKITRWNDPRLQELNAGVNLPDKDIIVVHRSDGSGTTFVFTDYLSEVSGEWKTNIGKGTVVNWPTGLGGKGNEGVAGLVSQNPYSIGYVEFIYAKKNNIPWGYVKNAAGEFVEPGLESFRAAAAAAAVTLPNGDAVWADVSIVRNIVHNKQAIGAYPITSFSYFIVYKDLKVIPGMDEEMARALVEFLWWTIHEGQNYSAELYYVPLPSNVVTHNEATLRMMVFNGKQLIG